MTYIGNMSITLLPTVSIFETYLERIKASLIDQWINGKTLHDIFYGSMIIT